jgi:glutamate-5-semialdehyde dehydrogenase
MSELPTQILEFGRRARAAARVLARTPSEQKNRGLRAMAAELLAASPEILEANLKDLEKARANGLSGAMLERLSLSPKKIDLMAEAILRNSAQWSLTASEPFPDT